MPGFDNLRKGVTAMELNEVCNRCGKTVTIPADADIMRQKIEEDDAVKQVIEAVQELAATFDDPLPEIITLTRKENVDGEGYMEVKALSTLCGPDETKKRNRHGCLNRVRNLVDDIHRVSKSKKKKEENENED